MKEKDTNGNSYHSKAGGEECKSSLGLSFYGVLSFEPCKSLCLIKLNTFKNHSGCSVASSCREKRREAGRPLGRW